MEHKLQARVNALSNEVKRLKMRLARSRQVEYELRQSEHRYRTLFDHTSVGLAQFDAHRKFLAANLPFCRLVGYTREELLRKTESDITYPQDIGLDARFRKQLLAGGQAAVRYEKRYVHKNGTVVWAGLTLSPVPAASDSAPSFLVVADNISGRRILQDSLHRIASSLTQMEALQPVGSWKWNIKTGLVNASDDTLRLYGLAKGSRPLPVSAFLDRIHPADRARFERAVKSARFTQKPYHLEYRILLPDGGVRTISSSGEVYRRDAQGAASVMIGMVQDVTLRRQAEAALRESEHRFRAFFDQAVDGIFIADQEGTYTDVNQSACRMLGYTREELIGMRINDLVPAEDAERLAEAKEYFTRSVHNVQVAEWKLRRKDGAYLDTEISARILPDGRWMAIVRDISDRKRTQTALEKYAEEIHDLYDNAPCGYHSVNRDDVFVRINKTSLDWLGYERDELVGRKTFADILTPESRKTYLEHRARLRDCGALRDLELDIVRKDGSAMPALLNASASIDAGGQCQVCRATVLDITALSEANRKLRQAATVFEHTSDAIIITDNTGRILAVNKAFTDITGYRPEEVIGKNPRILKSERQDLAFYQSLWESLERDGNWRGELWDRKKSGEEFPVWQNITAVRDVSGNVTEYISVFSDISSIKDTEQRLLELAYHDALTGLPNRLLFNDRLGHAIAHAKRNDTRVALLLLDLDRFKLINDTLGHAAGDRLLQVVADRLNQSVRAEDTIARLGGDEFAVVVGHLDSTGDAALLAEKIVKTIAEPIEIEGQPLATSTSIGIAIYPDDADDRDNLAKMADIAMYGAKNKGRNSFMFYTPAMTARATELLQIDHGLRNAILQNELELYYQPQVHLDTGRIVGVEVLVRWNHPEHGLQGPDRFIPVAEETHLIEALGEWVIDHVCHQIEHWSAEGIPPIRVAINLSPRQLKRPQFVEQIRARIHACKASEGYGIDLEVTESALQTAPEIIQALRELKSLGFRIAIDDFGTGFSSLNSLKQLPIDILKIDRAFVRGIPGDDDDRAITSAIIAMGHSLGLSIVAEGIETQEQLDFLRSQHCDDAQGFLLYTPVPAEECSRFLSASHEQHRMAERLH
ncbi:MAG TPA: PAS domain S-box protein [Noviherbaspirillum sp.]